MATIYRNFGELVGRTPLIELNRIKQELNLHATVIAKLEGMNPAGSVKDRIALSMVKDAESRGALKAGGTIIEPTSGNTGIGLAAIGASRGYKVILVMPDTMSHERRGMMAAYGAQLELTPGSEGMKGAIARAEEIAAQTPGSFIPGQFTNPANPAIHARTTGPEILMDTDGQMDFFVSGVGTGGTLTGAGQYLKQHIAGLKIVAVEPRDSPVLSQGKAGPHKIQGIGAGFVPEVMDVDVMDEVITVTNEDAFKMGRMIIRLEGIPAGISSGAALWAAVELARRPENAGKRIVAIFPDNGDRYLSSPMYTDG